MNVIEFGPNLTNNDVKVYNDNCNINISICLLLHCYCRFLLRVHKNAPNVCFDNNSNYPVPKVRFYIMS